MKKWLDEEIKIAIEMVQSGYTYYEISQRINKPTKSISSILIKNGYGFNNERRLNNRLKYKPRTNKTGKKCLNCNAELIGHNKKIFCSTACSGEYKRKEIFSRIENGDTSPYIKTIKNYLIYKFGNKCSICDWCEINEKSGLVPIQVDHIDGNSDNNELSNLRLLCPNCHSLTPTYGSLNKNGSNSKKNKTKLAYYYKTKKKYCECGNVVVGKGNICNKCSKIKNRKVVRPSLEILINDIKNIGYWNTGKKYGVSDNAIRKWIKTYGLNPKEIKKISTKSNKK